MENIKSKIIPNYLKNDIDEIMEQQLFNANRYYAESNPEISNLMQQELLDGPEEFLQKLKDRWLWHNTYYEELLEPSYQNLVKENHLELSPSEIDDLIKVYSISCLVDEATLIMSGVIKKYLDHVCKNINVISENISPADAYLMLITPPVETFFAQYQIDHLYYIYLLKTNDSSSYKFKQHLKEKYHANDEIIFNSRFNKKFSNSLNMSAKEILNKIKGYAISESYKVQHYYFTLEHSERKAIRDIIIYDNLDEKLIASNLIGISGFLLRKNILEHLNESGILKNKGYIYEFSNNIIIQSLERLKEEREKKMDKNVKPYKQRGDTCAIVCMLMALEYYKIIEKANWYDEKRFYKLYGSKYMDGTPFSALAYHLSKNGLDTSLYHSEEDLFDNSNDALKENDFKFAMEEYKQNLDRAVAKGTKVFNSVNINVDLLKEKLRDGNLVILAGEIKGYYHAVLLTGYEGNNFFVCDPLFKNKQVRTFNEIEEFMSTSIGKWFVCVNDKTKEKKKLINELDNFEIESKEYMKKKQGRSIRYEKR